MPLGAETAGITAETDHKKGPMEIIEMITETEAVHETGSCQGGHLMIRGNNAKEATQMEADNPVMKEEGN